MKNMIVRYSTKLKQFVIILKGGPNPQMKQLKRTTTVREDKFPAIGGRKREERIAWFLWDAGVSFHDR